MARYLTIHRPVLAPSDDAPAALWLSSNDGSAMTYLAMERIISMTTKETIGVDISPHLFRAAGVSSCAVWAGDQPDLGSALLHHTDPAIAQEHYNHATSLSANQSFESWRPRQATGVSRQGFTAFCEMPTFPKDGGQEPGL
jgi:hypothetical protein